MKAKIEHVEPQLAQKLGDPFKSVLKELHYPIPTNYELRVSLLDAKGKKKRRNEAAVNWSPASDRLQVWFEYVPSQEKETAGEVQGATVSAPLTVRETPTSSENARGTTSYIHPAEADLLRVLDRAELKPGWSFVPLKKFRDEILPSEHVPSLRTDVEQSAVLRSSIEKKLILVGKVPNPKSPQFPVTTIRVNRLLPEVRAIFGGGKTDLEFSPVEIKGEPLSATVMRERHR